MANTYEKFALGVRPESGKLMIERMAENDALVARFLGEADFQQIVSEGLAREIFAAVAEPPGEPSA